MSDLFSVNKPTYVKTNKTIVETFMPMAEFCRAFNVPYWYIRSAIDRGDIETFLINGKPKIRSEDGQRLIEVRPPITRTQTHKRATA